MSHRPAPLKVLLVEDQLADCMLAEEAFASMTDAVVLHHCPSGTDALAWLRAHLNELPDVVLLDLNLPGLSGLEVLHAIRDDPELRGQPVMVLSTSESPADIRRAYELLAGAYWVKPLSFSTLVEQIGALVRYCRHTRFPGRLSRAALQD
ncbi:response regulator (plasmid) [Deinococcus taeanensis]|uniref:response regulator n=1 Tax=Deinococcus taeanensis TaxID=2737050 RepID=UPI001CDC56BC|nr:response regulator [Deinococcus taeanensis]UBV45280.1 response regulator [Deinococcus taeanensis]